MKTKKKNKSEFVRNMPPTVSADEVVKRAAAAGLKITKNYVHTVRYKAKQAPQTTAAAPTKSSADRDRLVLAIAQLGYAEAREVFENIRALLV